MRTSLIGLLFTFFLGVPGLALANAGYIHNMSGKATITTAAGTTVPAVIGTIIAAGSTVRTEAQSNAVLKFEDGQIATLSENSHFRITEYNYNKADVAKSSAAFNLLQGGMRFVTGVIGSTNRNAVRLNAGTATIGIRGTDLVLLRNAVTQAVTAAVNNGAIEFAGLNISPGQAAVLPTPGATPQVGSTAAIVTGVQGNIVTGLNATPIPVNTPVVVAASARAAAATAQAAALPAGPAKVAAEAEATKLLADAIQLAQQALTTAIQAGAVPPTPSATPEQIQQQQQQLQQQLQQEQQQQLLQPVPLPGASPS